MPGATRILAFVAALAVIFAGALLAGRSIDPEAAEAPAEDHTGMPSAATHVPRGLAVSEGGATLVLTRAQLPTGRAVDLEFDVLGDDGTPLHDFDVEHERRMHLILVRRDFGGYQHLHPSQRRDGSWHTRVRLDEAGSYRVFADFTRDGDPVTLGADLQAAGDYTPRELPVPAETATLPGGYRVALHAEDGGLAFDVTRSGRSVSDIEPYLGAQGHLVALREGDLAYLHVHPDEHRLAFEVEYPSSGRYRLFLQFKHRGRIHTAEFTQEAGDADEH